MTANRKVTARYAEIARFLGLHFNEEFCVAYGEKDGFTLRVSGLDTGRGIEYGMVCISVGVAENGVALPRATLRGAVGAFLTNLSPKNKWLAAAVLLGIGALSLIIGLILKGGNADMATTIWIAAIIIFGVAEAATAGLTSIWFVLGGVAGLIAAVCSAPIWLQVALFFAVSIAALAFTRPLVVKLMKKDIKPTNADRVLGAVGRVTERIDNALPSGAVYIDGKTWTARSADGEVIEPDAAVRILRMEGVKLIVQKEQ